MSEPNAPDAPSAIDEQLRAEADAALEGAPNDAPHEAGEQPQADAPGVDDLPLNEAIAALLGVTFNELVAPVKGDHWKLADGELTALGTSYAAVLDKYFPNFTFGVELTALLMTAMVFGPRMKAEAVAQNLRANQPKTDDTPKRQGVTIDGKKEETGGEFTTAG